VLAVVGVSAATAAQPGKTLRVQARSLGAKTHRALLDLYAIDTRLHAANARIASLDAEEAQLRDEQQRLELQLVTTRHTLRLSRRQLGSNLSMLYKQGDISTLAVVLGAHSLDDAATRLDDLNRVADQSKQVVAETMTAQAKLSRLQAALRERGRTLAFAIADARLTAAGLASARSDRVDLIASLRRSEQLKRAQIDALQQTARRAEHTSAAIQRAAEAPTPAATAATAPAAPADGASTLTVSSTGYALSGHTATGLPVGWGVVAVDPSVIPLGTRLTIPGYGNAVAADTGSAVRGADIDLWFPTLAQARAWGRRTVTITLH
jgi:3D (Asp-Asp-Asp) domain-containing protein